VHASRQLRLAASHFHTLAPHIAELTLD